MDIPTPLIINNYDYNAVIFHSNTTMQPFNHGVIGKWIRVNIQDGVGLYDICAEFIKGERLFISEVYIHIS